MNKEIVYQVDALQNYDYENSVPLKWSFQLFLKDTYDIQKHTFEKKPQAHTIQADPDEDPRIDVQNA